VFGALSLLVLVIQIVTGIFLVMHYKPDASLAFASVEYIMRDVPWGWLIRYMHSTGSSAFFIVVYLHMFRGLMYGSYRKPRELVWIFGCAIFLCLMAEAFMGYLLPWGQMSYWGAQVIVNLFSAIPFIGPDLALLIRGDFVVGDATLNRFFSFHVIAVPLVLLGLVVAHIIALHEVGSNNPDGVEIKAAGAPKDAQGHPLDGIPFHPYYTVHDIFSVSIFLMVFTAIVFFAPEFGGYFLEYNNFIPADPLKTPLHIAPVWYFTPYYSMLRAITGEMMYVLIVCALLGAFLAVKNNPMPNVLKAGVVGAAVVISALMYGIDAKFWGVVVMGGAVVIMFFLPWLDNSPVKSIRYRPEWHKYVYAVFVIDFLILGYLGVQPPSPIGERVSQVGTLFYFGFFLLMPWWSKLGTPKPVPDRVVFVAH
jgi:ubiquinol-cytochrome c reductase cytochrome b subunit